MEPEPYYEPAVQRVSRHHDQQQNIPGPPLATNSRASEDQNKNITAPF